MSNNKRDEIIKKANQWARDNGAEDWGSSEDPVDGAAEAYIAGVDFALEEVRKQFEERLRTEKERWGILDDGANTLDATFVFGILDSLTKEEK